MLLTTHSEPQTAASLDALLHAAAVAPLPGLALLEVTGEDRLRWLNGMATNSIQSLEIGQGCYNFFLSAQGRIQADATAFRLPESILLEISRERLPALIALLDRFIIMDDVLLNPLESTQGLLIAGPEAAQALARLALEPPKTGLEQTTWNNHSITLIQAHSPVVPRFELWSDPATLTSIESTLSLPRATPETLEHLRLLEGTPLYGTDIRDRELPQETAQARALHFAKGCYLGQEIVERIRSRGNVHRTLSGFVLTGDLPVPGTSLLAENKAVGELTSAALIPLLTGPIQLALGYIRREILDRNLPITYAGGTAEPTILPYPV